MCRFPLGEHDARVALNEEIKSTLDFSPNGPLDRRFQGHRLTSVPSACLCFLGPFLECLHFAVSAQELTYILTHLLPPSVI